MSAMGRQRPLRTLQPQGPLSGAERPFDPVKNRRNWGLLSATSGRREL